MTLPRVLVLTGYGLNCDNETVYACKKAGMAASRVHINELIDGGVDLFDFQLMVFGGGFSWGDEHGGGVIQSVRMQTALGDGVHRFIEKGHLLLGICNGFQVLVNWGLLPGFENNYSQRQVALTANNCGNFRNQWVTLRINPNSPSVFTKGMDQIDLPVRHGEGRFFAEDEVVDRLIQNDQVVMQYADENGRAAQGVFPQNPNGSLADIAGICDPTGRVFGLMPHPEAYNHVANHPDWPRDKIVTQRESGKKEPHPVTGINIFENVAVYLNKHM